MRIIVLGDFHMHEDQLDLTEAAMEDIAACRPDLVVPLGDFGSSGKIGRVEGLEQAKVYLDKIGAPLRPILGNHDIEREAGAGPQPHGTMERALLELFGLESAYGFWEAENFRLLFVSTDPQPPDSCYQVQECYVSEQQFASLKEGLAQRPGVPVIAFTHAPPLGSRLRTVPGVHVRATNAYLDQNHDPYRWLRLCEEHPEIVLWFSAHYHLGHVYPDAHTVVHGTRFFLTGVHGRATRDSRRQSRVIDIRGDEVHVWTLDHVVRELSEEGAWRGRLRQWQSGMSAPPKRLATQTAERVQEVPVGDGPVAVGQLATLPSGRALAGTADGFAWEIDLPFAGVMGTLQLDEPLSALAVGEDGVWLASGTGLRWVDPADPWRFIRDRRRPKPEPIASLPADIAAICARPSGGVFVAAGAEVWAVASPQAEPRRLFELPGPIEQIAASDGRLWLRDATHSLWLWEGAGGPQRKRDGVFAIDAVGDASVWLGSVGGRLQLTYKGAGESWECQLPADVSASGPDAPAAVVSLGRGRVGVMIGKRSGIAENGEYEPLPLSAPATAIGRGRVSEGAVDSLLVAVEGRGEWGRPQLEVWELKS